MNLFICDFNLDVMELSNCEETVFIYSVFVEFCGIVNYIIIYTL